MKESDFDVMSWLEQSHGEKNLLGVCPVSEEIIEAALLEAKEKQSFMPMFIATPRQVDADRGYTGWSQSGLIDFVESIASDIGYPGNYLVARDHGGPYQSMRDRDDPEVSLQEAMEYAKETFKSDLEAGFDIIHVDATEDARKDEILDLSETARRTAELISYMEDVKDEEDVSDAYYEVGTEEISGGMTEPDSFEEFIHLLKQELKERGREKAAKKLLFIVGQVGTTMRIDMTNKFDPEQAETLVDIAGDHDLFLKVHYTDWLDNQTLERFPEIGIGAANVGPEFAAAIVETLFELEAKEIEALEGEGKSGQGSNFTEIMEKNAVEKTPWQRFAPEDLGEDELDDYAEENKENIAICVGRYVLNEPEVKEARKKLNDNLSRCTSIDPHSEICKGIQESIHRYVESFNLA